MQVLHWELSVLGRAVGYQNLSSAADNIGLSQPQLSRIVAKLEAELGLVLLDRSSRRKSGWTQSAFELAETYSRSAAILEKEILAVALGSKLDHLRVASLEGLAPLASSFCYRLLDGAGLVSVELDVHDLIDLEALFLKGRYDLIFVARSPGRKKPAYERLVGYQAMERQGEKSSVRVLSSFEHQTQKTSAKRTRSQERVLVSNSLVVRRYWLETCGGTGVIPTSVSAKAREGKSSPVYLIGADLLPPQLWREISGMKLI